MDDSEEDWEENNFFIPVAIDDSGKSRNDEVWARIDELIREGWEKVFESDATRFSIPEGLRKIDLRNEPPWAETHGTHVTLKRRKP